MLWENGPRVTTLLQVLKERGLDLLQFRGKGRAVWLGLGIATLDAAAIALHDADITTYDRTYPLRLLYPLLEREFGIAFSKAYYARIGESPPESAWARHPIVCNAADYFADGAVWLPRLSALFKCLPLSPFWGICPD